MASKNLIPVEELLQLFQAEKALIEYLIEEEVIPVINLQQTKFIEARWLPEIRRARRLFTILDINFEGIGIILRMRQQIVELLEKIEQMEEYYQSRFQQLRQEYEKRLSTIQQVIILELPQEDRYIT